MNDLLWITKRQESNRVRNNRFYYLTIFCVVFGNSVGIAIFTQNQVAINKTQNPLALLAMYGFVGLSCITLLLVCLELMSSSSNKFNTIPHWMRNFFNRQIGSISAIFYSFIYMPIVITALALVSWGSFFNVIDAISVDGKWIPDNAKAALILVFSLISVICLILFNAYSSNYKEYIIIFLNFVKIIPILFVVASAIGAFVESLTWDGTYHTAIENNNNIFTMLFGRAGTGTDVWSVKAFALGAPMVMLSFDGFLHGVSVSNDSEQSKAVSFSSIIAVISVIFINIMLAALLLGTTTDANVLTLLGKMLPKWLTYIIAMSFCFCVLGSIIGFGSFGTSNYYTATDPSVEGGQLMGTMSGWQLSYESAAWRQLAIYVVYMAVSYTISYPMNKQFIHIDPINAGQSYYAGDAASQTSIDMASIVVVFSFIFYTNLIFALVINRFTKRRDVRKIVGFGTIGIILTPILWFFCLYSLFIDLSNIVNLKKSDWLSDKDQMRDTLTALLTVIEIGAWAIIVTLNELRLRRVKFSRIFSNSRYI